MRAKSRQLIILGAATSRGETPGAPYGARCPLVAVVDLERLADSGWAEVYGDGADGLDIGWLLHDALSPQGWDEVRIHDVTPVAALSDPDALEPEVLAAMAAAAREGVGHIVFTPGSHRLN